MNLVMVRETGYTQAAHFSGAPLYAAQRHFYAGRFAVAEELCREILHNLPDDGAAHQILAGALHMQGRLGDSLIASRRALAIYPGNMYAHLTSAHTLLLMGRFQEGWEEWEWRFKCKAFRLPNQEFKKPRWDGSPLEGRTVLLHEDHENGDTIQMVRYVPIVAALGGRVIVRCQRRLFRLVRSVSMVDQVIAEGDEPLSFDVHVPLFSLPCILKTELDTIPADVPYLTAEDARIGLWRRRIGNSGFRVGIVWQGNPASLDDHWGRSIPLRCFEPLARIPGVRLISLQKIHGLEQLTDLPEGMAVETLGGDFDEGPDGFVDTAAAMMALDLIITCDTSVAHLAGALGRPVWVALKWLPDWRWMMGRRDSPWYPMMRLFRQKTPGDWEGVFREIKDALP